MNLNKSRFVSEIIIRPDDIDLNQHVHSSRYMDFVLAARYDQMERCYKFSMADFIKRGFGWVMTDSKMHFKRPMILGDIAQVTTWVESFERSKVEVHFEIHRKGNPKVCCDGWFLYSMINTATGRAAHVPHDILEKYSI